jgi:flavin-dependent dehydrogenase
MKNSLNLLRIYNNSKVIVIGGGPAGAFFSYYILKLAKEKNLNLDLSILEGKYFVRSGPPGCNFCAGVLSETLIKKMERIGIILPQEIAQSSVEGYCMLTKKGELWLTHPLHARKIATVFRGNGPLFSNITKNISFDDFLLREALKMGARVYYKKVSSIELPSKPEEKVLVKTEDETFEADLVVGAFGLNTDFLEKVKRMGFGYKPPKVLKTCQTELKIGSEFVKEKFKDFIFILNIGIKGFRFSAIIPKGEYITITLVGNDDLTFSKMEKFLKEDFMKKLLPDGFSLPHQHCHCLPRIAVTSAKKPFTDRFVIIGDASCSRYYKNGIESALITASLAAETAINLGISEKDFRKGYWRKARKIIIDNFFGRLLFSLNDFIARADFIVESHIRIARSNSFPSKILRNILWNMFTGNIDYWRIFLKSVNPFLLIYMAFSGIRTILDNFFKKKKKNKESKKCELMKIWEPSNKVQQ